MEKFVGKYRLVGSENFDEFMKKIGLGFAKRAIANATTPVVEISQLLDGRWRLFLSSVVKNSEIIFNVGEEFTEVTPDDAVVKNTVTLENGSFIQHQKATKSGDKDRKVVHYLDDENNLVALLICEEVECKRMYKRE